MNKFFPEIKKNFGFGMMRLPLNEDKTVDYDQVSLMIDEFLEKGFNYFDTAKPYLNGQSEIAVKKCLASRYPRDKYVLTNKLSRSYFETYDDLKPMFDNQLEACGVDYFDFYLLHAQSKDILPKYFAAKAYEFAFEMKKEGKVKHVGISFHDSVEVLEEILDKYPEIEVVQIQFNYFDYNDANVQSKKLYDLCKSRNIPNIVMEPVKGGSLVNLDEDSNKLFASLNNGSNASYAIRFAASHENNMMVLSGMSNIEQMRDNLSYMTDFVPLSKKEYDVINQVVENYHAKNLIGCTKCHYCTDGCPQSIQIPEIIECLNQKSLLNNWQANSSFEEIIKTSNKPSSCLKCGQCESMCPQSLPIISILEKASVAFEKE